MGVAIIRVTDLAQARRAIAEARADGDKCLLVSAAEITAFAGAGYWHALETLLARPIVIDCGDDAGLAMAAMREGSRDLLFTGPEVVAVKLAGMAAQLGATLRRRLDAA
jgi:hypothetical protein